MMAQPTVIFLDGQNQLAARFFTFMTLGRPDMLYFYLLKANYGRKNLSKCLTMFKMKRDLLCGWIDM